MFSQSFVSISGHWGLSVVEVAMPDRCCQPIGRNTEFPPLLLQSFGQKIGYLADVVSPSNS
jgi:hypothetical protein